MLKERGFNEGFMEKLVGFMEKLVGFLSSNPLGVYPENSHQITNYFSRHAPRSIESIQGISQWKNHGN